MTDKSDTELSDEYTYSEENYTDAYPKKKANPLSGIMKKLTKRKGLMVFIGVILVLYVVFKLLNFMEGKGKLTTEQQKQQHTAVVQKTTTANNVASHQKLNSLHMVTSEQHSRITQLRSGLVNVNGKLYNIQRAVGELNSSLRRLENVVARQVYLQRQVQMAKLKRIHRKAKSLYRVYAVIPNRAWILNSRGETLTVKLGSFLPGAGKVVSIDSVTGTVTTNTGARLTFSLADQ